MFGQEAGAEKRLGKLNQHVVTRVYGKAKVFWVFHTRGEDPVSVLIMSLNKDVEAQRMKADEVFDIIARIDGYKTLLDKADFDRVSMADVTPWGKTTGQTKISALVNAAKDSCVLAWQEYDSEQ
jgi:hypothetical protein